MTTSNSPSERVNVAIDAALLPPPPPTVYQYVAELRNVIHSYHAERCYACGFPLAKNRDKGCVPGDCSYRPSEHACDYEQWHRRMKFLEAVRVA